MAEHLKYDPITGHLLYRPASGHLVYACPEEVEPGDCDCETMATQAEFESATCYLAVDINVPEWQGDPTPWVHAAGDPTRLALTHFLTFDPGGPAEKYGYHLTVGVNEYVVFYFPPTGTFQVSVEEDPFLVPADGGVSAGGLLTGVNPCGGDGDFTDFDSTSYGQGLDGTGTFSVQLCLPS
jgi:hypothetical protein